MVFDKVKEILCLQLKVDEDSISLDSSIIDDLGADSLDVVDIIMTLQDEFDIEIPDEEVENIKTVGELVGFIESAC